MQTQRVKDDIRPLALKTYICAIWSGSDHDDITFYILLDILSLFAMRTM